MSAIHKEAARLRGEARTAEVEAKVREAMVTIQKEMAGNNGIYPENGGAVSMNEVSRRAKISETTLFSPKQKELGKNVKAWVESLKKKEVVGRMRVRRTVFERSEDWRKKYLALQDTHIATELDLQDSKVQLQNAQQSLAELNYKYDALLEQMRAGAASKVTSFPKGKR
jgi:AraC-like DNA-binding protein